MSIATELSRIQTDRNTIRTKLVELGLASTTANLDTLATAVADIVNRGAVSVEIIEGTTYTIPAGYHNGSGVVKALTDTAGEAATYKTQAKTVTPTKSLQNVVPDTGYYALESVTVNAIPDAYQDVSSVTSAAGDVLTGKVFVAADGTVTTGTMTNNGTVSKTLDGTTVSYTIPKGYHSGSGTVTITLETKTVTPTKATQTVSPTSGKVLSKVTVNPIPDNYITTTDATAEAEQILDGETAYVNGVKVEGTMANNGAVSKTLDTTTTSYTIPAGYHNGSGKVSHTLEIKTATPTKADQNIVPTSGRVLSKVTVEAIPQQYADASDATANEAHILSGKTAYICEDDPTSATGKLAYKATGSMANHGAVTATIDGLTTTSYTVPNGFHSGQGTVSLTNDIEEALAAI